MSHHFIRFEGLSFAYPDGFKALDNVSFQITHGEHVALLGLNGAGKSTLLLLTNGLLLPTEGLVNVGGIPVTRKTLELVRKSVGMVFQNPDDMLFMPTVEEDVAFGPINMGLPPEEIERRVVTALESVNCLHLRKRTSSELSGGQKRMVALATVLSMEPDILVLDEPSSNLDLKARRQLINILKGFRHTLLLATHDISLVEELCPRSIVLDEGKVIGDSTTDEVLDNQELCSILGI